MHRRVTGHEQDVVKGEGDVGTEGSHGESYAGGWNSSTGRPGGLTPLVDDDVAELDIGLGDDSPVNPLAQATDQDRGIARLHLRWVKAQEVTGERIAQGLFLLGREREVASIERAIPEFEFRSVVGTVEGEDAPDGPRVDGAVTHFNPHVRDVAPPRDGTHGYVQATEINGVTVGDQAPPRPIGGHARSEREDDGEDRKADVSHGSYPSFFFVASSTAAFPAAASPSKNFPALPTVSIVPRMMLRGTRPARSVSSRVSATF